jgi:cellulose synthase/poly-beta-1,6-N-acetylglucosamine synthase-like glycosyltransferase
MIDFSFIISGILLITGINYICLIFYFTYGWFKVSIYKHASTNFSTKVSILIPFRNEENNIITCLAGIIKQDFPLHLMEVILIDDHSTDKSLEKVIEFKLSNPGINFNIIELKKMNLNISSKKFAIKEGISFSSGELIITTDADCIMNKSWVKSIVSYYEKYNPNMIIAPVSFTNVYSLFDKMQHLEFLSLQSIGTATVGINHPILSNGANLAYKKEMFFAVEGFKSNEDIASGDDVFLLHQFHKMFPGTIHFVKSSDALIYTNPQRNIVDFINQRKRWTSKSKSYQDVFAKYVAISVFLFCLSIFCALLFSIFNIKFMYYFGLFYVAKLVIDFPLLFQITKFIKKQRLLIMVPFLELLYPIYIVFIAIYGNIGKYTWKDRKIK